MASTTAVSELWLDAVKAYEEGLGQDSDLKSRIGQMSSSEDVQKRIATWSDDFGQFRERHRKLWSRINEFLDPFQYMLEQTSSPLSQTSFGMPVGVVVDVVVNVIKACQGVTSHYDQLEKMFLHLKRFSARLELYQNSSHAIEEPLKKPVINMFQLVLKILGRSEHLIRKGRAKLAIRTFFWGEDVKTKELLEELNQSFAFEKGDVMAANYQRGRKIEENTEKANAFLERSQSRNEKDRLRLCLIGDTSSDKNVREIYKKYQVDLAENTAAWLQEEPQFQDWLAGRISLLWLVGKAGMGKSCIATALIRDLEKKDVPNMPPTAYFFIKEDDKELRNANVILKTIAWQLQNQDPSYQKHLIQIFSDDVETEEPEDTWKNLFLSYYQSGNTDHSATVIIDGLDEADETRITLLRLLAGSHSDRPSSSLRFAILGRPEMFYSEFSEKLRLNSSLIRNRINVVQSKNKEAIEQYVRKRIGRMAILKRLHRSQGKTVASRKGSNWGMKIIGVAKGVFLFTRLLLDQIEHAGSPSEVEMALTSPPINLGQMIGRLFKRLEDDPVVMQNKETFRLILLHTTYSRRTIIAGEVDVLINATKQETGLALWEFLTTKFRSIFDLNEIQEEDKAEQDEENLDNIEESGSDLGSSSFDLDFSGTWKEEDEEGDESLGEFDESDLEIEFEEDDEDQDSGVEDLDDDAPKDWVFDTDLSAAQIKTPLSFSHQLILEAIRQEGTRKSISFLPEAETAEAEMAINCLRILRATLPAADEWRFLAEYPLRNLSFHLNEAYKGKKTTSSQREAIIEGLYWLFGTEAGANGLMRASEDLDMSQFEELFKQHEKDGKRARREDFAKQDTWSRRSFWDSWVATDENIRIVQKWLATYDEDLWEGHLSSAALSWVKAASKSLPELLRQIMKASVKMSLTCPGYDHMSMIRDHSWGISLAHGWLSMIENGPMEKFSSIDFEKSHRRMHPERIERIAALMGKPLDSMGLFFIGLFMSVGRNHQAALHYYTEATSSDPRNWRAHEFIAWTHTIDPQINYSRAVARQALANSLCKEHPRLRFLFSDQDGVRLGRKLSDYVTEAIQEADFSTKLIAAMKELEGFEYQLRAMTYLIQTHPETAKVLEDPHKKHSKDDVQFLADVIESLLSSKTGFDDAFIQGQVLYELSGRLKSEITGNGPEWLAKSLGSMAKTLNGTQKELMYRTWASVYSTRVYLDQVLLATTPEVRSDSVLALQSLAESIIGAYQGSREQEEYLSVILPRLTLRLCNSPETNSPQTVLLSEMMAPWIVTQISRLEDSEMQNREAKNSRLLILSKVLNLMGESDGETLYTALLGYALLCCGEIDVVSAEPKQDSLGFEVSGIMPFCDGLSDNCRPDVTNCAELWRCEVCADRHWCGECVSKLQNEGDGKLCHAQHVFKKIWPIPSESYGPAMVWYQNKVWLQGEWWEKFKTKWTGLSSCN